MFSTLSTKCLAQHAQLIHISRVEPVFAQRTQRLTIIMLSLSKHPVAPKPCHLAHRFSQTCIPSLSGLCGAVRGSSAGVHEFKLTWPLQVNTAALTALSGALLSWFRRLSIALNEIRFTLARSHAVLDYSKRYWRHEWLIVRSVTKLEPLHQAEEPNQKGERSMFEKTPAQKLGITGPSAGKPKTPYATAALILGWALLAIGILGFVTNIDQRGLEGIAVASLVSGVFCFAILGVLSEIARLLAKQK